MKVPPASTKVTKTEPEYLIRPLFDEEGVQRTSGIGRDGREYPDPVPMAPPVGYEPPTQLEDLISQILERRDFLKSLGEEFESPEEADDFDVDDDEDLRFPETVYEAYFEAKSKRKEARRLTENEPVPPPSATSENAPATISVAPVKRSESTSAPKTPKQARVADDRTTEE